MNSWLVRLDGEHDTSSGWMRGFKESGKVYEQLRASRQIQKGAVVLLVTLRRQTFVTLKSA